jgi:hypothetical protein
MKAKLLYLERSVDRRGGLIEMVLWQLPEISPERPHGFKYRFYYGDAAGRCLVRYDNERGKGDHRHYAGGVELPYEFRTVEELLRDFRADVERAQGANDDGQE